MTRRTRRSESGSILVELTLVVPILMLIVAGMIEVGAAWRDKSTVVQASRQGARVASHLANEPETDFEALSAVVSIVPGSGLSKDLTIKKIVIFDATMSDTAIAACKDRTTSATGCNVYDETRLTTTNLVIGNFTSSPNYDGAWEPTTRLNGLTTADEVGVYVIAERPLLTNIFPGLSTQRITAFTIMRLEPPIS